MRSGRVLQRPRLFGGEIAVGIGDDPPDGVKRPADRLRFVAEADLGNEVVGCREDRLVLSPQSCRVRNCPAAVSGDHRQRALGQIAKVVGKIGIDAIDDRLMAVVSVLAEGNFAQKEIAHLVDAVAIDQSRRIDDIADRLRHLLAAVEQEAMRKDARRAAAGGPTSGRPANRRCESARCPCRSHEGRPANIWLAEPAESGNPVAER